ncbi:MAG: YbaK/EbsC family protein [Chloroflexi bacterium]|jgi:Cys-tRNA(Pro)/Cys-tRNA(Cys) deacylase|nr:YbaK/EbsC family protein [Chloroflexota bacterium]MBT3669822.1 YbaK/EbsC family protein [Chloroflexota bacterium]MBT4002416.1 YbaK/EbsC family protein [Chloroflexota bacterium]MBT4304723.1 YbaK/EbsC family protein [Chloroflexota bacterium]MBT4534775.1 YbaK/EbsC family protein [Chloroflexota bacterium]
MTPSPVATILQKIEIDFTEFVHPGPVHSIEQAAEERDQSLDQIIRSILFRLSENKYAMVLIAGPSQVNWKTLRNHFNQSRLSMAKPEEVLDITGCEIGAVSPFRIPQDIPFSWMIPSRNNPSFRLAQGEGERRSFSKQKN